MYVNKKVERIHDMRDTHYIIFCHSKKKQLIIVFLGGQHNGKTADLRLLNGCRAYRESRLDLHWLWRNCITYIIDLDNVFPIYNPFPPTTIQSISLDSKGSKD